MASPLTQDQLDHFRQRLLGEEADLIAERDGQMEQLRAYTSGTDESNENVEDEAGEGTSTFERERSLTVAETLTAQLEQVRHALARMDQGLYGICEVTGEPIDVERLEAIPSATTSIRGAQMRKRL